MQIFREDSYIKKKNPTHKYIEKDSYFIKGSPTHGKRKKKYLKENNNISYSLFNND